MLLSFNNSFNNGFKKSLLSLAFVASSTLLAACGGSGGGSPATIAAPTLPPPPPPAPVNTAPVVSGETTPMVAENTTLVGVYTATDAEDNAVTFTLGGTDAALFTIDAEGNLSFVTAPDFDNGETGPFEVVVIATDDGEGNLVGEFTIEVSIGNVVDPAVNAVVQTIAPDFLSSEVVFMDGQTQQVSNAFYVKAKSDYTIDTYQSSIYHIGRFSADTIDKYDTANPDAQIWTHSTQDAEDSDSRNPYALISLNDTKAYLLRYGSDKVWIVNPQEQQLENFKIGEIDLSAYILTGNTNGTPRPSAATIVDGKLYIAMQRLSDFWAPDTAYIAVFDTTTDEEIETNANADDALKGIPLAGMNPIENSVISANGKIYVTTSGQSFPLELSTSQIEEINLTDYSVRSILTAADITDNSTFVIKGSVVVSEEKGYFYTSAWADSVESSTLYEFNPTTGDIVTTDVGGNGTETISYVTLDKSNILWVSIANSTNPGVDLIVTETNEKTGVRLSTVLNPKDIRFVD